jgi:aspartate dehydrogenase
MIHAGLIGCGAIGSTLAKAIKEGKAGQTKLDYLCDIEKELLDTLYDEIGDETIEKTTDILELIESPRIDLIIEAASREVVTKYAPSALKKGKNLMLMSVGALADTKLCNEVNNIALEKNLKIYLPSGAICGLDGIKAASIEKIDHVEIISTKNPRSLIGAPYLLVNDIDISKLEKPETVFTGKAKDAINGFPKNVNVAVALSLAGIGVEKTHVKIVADPNATKTRHEIRAIGDFGELVTKIDNYLHPENPKTSYIAALAGVRTLKKISEPIQIGT